MEDKIKYEFKKFTSNSTIHGLYLLGYPKLHILERIIWFAVICISATWSITVVKSNFDRYVANPTVVSMQKDFRNWENPFPAVTACFIDKTDMKKAQAYIYEKWNLNPSDPKYDYYYQLVKTVANATYNNLDQFKEYENDESLNDIDLLEVAQRVHPPITGTLVTFRSSPKSKWQPISTEVGICFTVNSKYAYLFALRIDNSTTATNSFDNLLRCHYLNGLCYARYDSDPNMPLKYYIHSYLDIVHTTSEPPLIVRESEEWEINYRMIETTASQRTRYLTPSQRKCRFDDEPLTADVPGYSTSMCYVVCRYKLAMKLCGCRPFFYNFLEGKPCSIKDMACLAKHKAHLGDLPQQIGCNCPQPCDFIIYLKETPKLTKWEHGYFDQRITFRWGLSPPTTKYYRDIIFGLEDLIVSFGGTLALFLGVSFMTLIELPFLIVDGLYQYYRQQRR